MTFHEKHLDALVAFFGSWVPLADKTVYLTVPGMDKALAPLGETLGFEIGMLKYVLAMFLAYPLSGILNVLPSANAKHAFSLLVGLWYAQEIFGNQWVHSFLSAAVSYLIVCFGPRKHIATLVFLFTMTYMSVSHLYRLYVDYLGWSLDFTGPQMILTIKLSSFAYNVYDGVVDLDTISKPQENKLKIRVYKERLRYAITSIPSPLAFFGYVYSFSTFLAGPAFEYADYASVIDGSAFAKKGGKEGGRPSSLMAALWRLFQGVLCLALHLVGSAKFSLSNVLSEEVLAMPFFERWLFTLIALFFCRMKYYFAWKVAEGSCVVAGFGFEGYAEDGSVKGWNGISNMDILGFETATNTAEASKAWNKGTQKWLQRYVYFRNSESLIITYFVSAFWHGFYPGYYLFFFSIALVQTVQRAWQKKVSPMFASIPKLYHLLCIIVFSAYINYFSIVFQVLAWDRAMAVWKSAKYWGHFATVAAYALTCVLPSPKKDGGKKA